MAHILLGWELGGQRGHALRLKALSQALRGRGHKVSFALQRTDILTAEELEGSAAWQAPMTPRLLVNTRRSEVTRTGTMGDILARSGFEDPSIVAGMIGAWRPLLDAVRPDIVVAEFAPWLLLSARGRVPAVSIGTGFETPPADMPSFPTLHGSGPAADEAGVLAAVNEGLRRAGADGIDALPQIMGGGPQVAATFPELDPYREHRRDPHALPVPVASWPGVSAGEGDEIFVYGPENTEATATMWEGLAQSGLPVRAHIPRQSARDQDSLRAKGIAVEPHPLPFAEIVRRSRLILSHGGHGITCSALLAGVPHVACHRHLEGYLNGRAIGAIGAGGHVAYRGLTAEPFAESLRKVHGDEELQRTARAAAERIREYDQIPYDKVLTDKVDALLDRS